MSPHPYYFGGHAPLGGPYPVVVTAQPWQPTVALELPSPNPPQEDPDDGDGSVDLTASGSMLASTPPCRHNTWDNVRVKKGVVTLCCRTCRLKWKTSSSVPKCPEFFHGHCYLHPDCPMLHVHRYKNKEKSPDHQVMAPSVEQDPALSAALAAVFATMGGEASGLGPRDMIPALVGLVDRLTARLQAVTAKPPEIVKGERGGLKRPSLMIKLPAMLSPGGLPSPLGNPMQGIIVTPSFHSPNLIGRKSLPGSPFHQRLSFSGPGSPLTPAVSRPKTATGSPK